MPEAEPGPRPEAAPLGELSVAVLLLLFGGVTIGLIRTFDAPPIGRLDLLLNASSLAMLATALVWFFLLALRRGALWWLGMLVPYVNLLVASSFARRYWSDGARAPALLALLGMVLQTVAAVRMLSFPLAPLV
jgi:hypothetical protein